MTQTTKTSVSPVVYHHLAQVQGWKTLFGGNGSGSCAITCVYIDYNTMQLWVCNEGGVITCAELDVTAAVDRAECVRTRQFHQFMGEAPRSLSLGTCAVASGW